MQTVIVVVHLLIVIVLVGIILLQHSEGGGLGIGGSAGFMMARGTKNSLTRLTTIFAIFFFLSSIILTVFQSLSSKSGSDVLDRISISNSSQKKNLMPHDANHSLSDEQ